MIVDPLPLRRLTEPPDATVALPGSKSLTNRALLCAGLAAGRSELTGVLFSDDLEMAAVALAYPVEVSAVASIRAGCDVLLVCSNEDWQDRALDALVAEATTDAAFRARCVDAATRGLAARRRFPPSPAASFDAVESLCTNAEMVGLQDEITRRAAEVKR